MTQLPNYQFALVAGGQVIAVTNLDEDDQHLAEQLFMQDFGWQQRLGTRKDVEVRLLQVEDEETSEFGRPMIKTSRHEMPGWLAKNRPS